MKISVFLVSVHGVVKGIDCELGGLADDGCQYPSLRRYLPQVLEKLWVGSNKPAIDRFEIGFAEEGQPIFPLDCPGNWKWPLTKAIVIAMASDESNYGFWSRWEAMLAEASPYP